MDAKVIEFFVAINAGGGAEGDISRVLGPFTRLGEAERAARPYRKAATCRGIIRAVGMPSGMSFVCALSSGIAEYVQTAF